MSYGKATSYLPVTDLLRGYFEVDSRDTVQRIREKINGKILTLNHQAGRVRGHVLLGDLWSLPGEVELANQSYEQSLQEDMDANMRQIIANKRHQPHTVVRDGARIAFYEHGSGEI